VSKVVYWCVFCSYKERAEVAGGVTCEEYRRCPRCGNGMFCWEDAARVENSEDD